MGFDRLLSLYNAEGLGEALIKVGFTLEKATEFLSDKMENAEREAVQMEAYAKMWELVDRVAERSGLTIKVSEQRTSVDGDETRTQTMTASALAQHLREAREKHEHGQEEGNPD